MSTSRRFASPPTTPLPLPPALVGNVTSMEGKRTLAEGLRNSVGRSVGDADGNRTRAIASGSGAMTGNGILDDGDGRLGRRRLLLEGRLSSLESADAVLRGSLVVDGVGGGIVGVDVEDDTSTGTAVVATASSASETLADVADDVKGDAVGSSDAGVGVGAAVDVETASLSTSGPLVVVDGVPRAAASSCCSSADERRVGLPGTSCTRDSPVTSGELLTVFMMGLESLSGCGLLLAKGAFGCSTLSSPASTLTR